MASLFEQHKIITTIVLGILPSFLWLLFWLKEGATHKRPFFSLLLTFLGGAAISFLLIPLGPFIKKFQFPTEKEIFVFALLEEFSKFTVVFLIDAWKYYIIEPIDYVIYLITGALGFAAFENILYLLNPQVQQNIFYVIETSTFRYIGPTVLHSVLAGFLGIIIGFTFYKRKFTQFISFIFGLGVVTILHTFYNYYIKELKSMNAFLSLGILWLLALIIISFMEHLKKLRY